MAYNQSFQRVKPGLISSTSSANLINSSNNVSEKSSKYGELSSNSGIESDWVVFSPSINEDDEEVEDETDDDEVLSTTNEYDDNDHDAAVESGDDDEDSLIDSLDTDQGLKLSLPTHDGSGNFLNSYINGNLDDVIALGSSSTGSAGTSEHDAIFNKNLSKEDFITTRIDNWRREQAKVLIEELQQGSTFSGFTTREPSPVNDLLASWGVDDRNPIESNLDNNELYSKAKPTTSKQHQVQSKPYKHGPQRFYGDDIFGNYSEWEVSMIKKVAKELSSSLVRDRKNESMDYRTGMRSRRSSLLSNLSKNAINNYLMGNSHSYFWKKDLSSAHSSISTNSIMFNSWGDVA